MISILCPTRNRPDKLLRMIDSVTKTARTDRLEIVLYVDDDDHSYDAMKPSMACADGHGYLLVSDLGRLKVSWITGERMVMSDMWNHLLPYASGDIFMLCGDDCVFLSPGWDTQVENAFARSEDKILLVFGDDGGPAGKVFATHPFVHRRWIEVIGYFSGPGFSCDYADTWPQDVATMLDRKQFRDFKIEHMHAVWGKAEWDQTYKESNARLHRDKTPQRYENLIEERKRDAEKLRAVMNTPWKDVGVVL